MNDTGDGDGQDFDKLSEESFDFGHFHELDSDAEEPVVEHDSVDPFTAALREESFLYGTPTEEVDEKFAFTQRLLTNAQTLKQLRSSGAPAVEIDYEDDRDQQNQEEVPPAIQRRRSSDRDRENQPAPAPVPSQGSSTIYSQFDARLSEPASQPLQVKKPYITLTQRTYKSLQSLQGESMVTGKYHDFPARLLQPYTLDQCRILLEQTRVYTLPPRQSSTRICLQDLYHARDITECPVYKIVQFNGLKVLLQDEHVESPCTVIAVLTSEVPGDLGEGEYMKLIRFHFDHAATIEPGKTRKVTIDEEIDESFYSSPDNPFPAAQTLSRPDKPVESRELRSVLMISEYEIVSMHRLKREWSKEEAMKRMFESDVPLAEATGTQLTTQTDYSDPFGEHLDMNDFPVNQVT